MIYLILSAGLKMLKQLERSALQYGHPGRSGSGSDGRLFRCMAVSFSSIFYILLSGAAGLLVYAVQRLRKGEKKP